MKQKKNVRKSLPAHKKSDRAQPQLEVRLAKAAEPRRLQCEVVAVAPDAKSEKGDAFVLHQDFTDYQELAKGLVERSEFSPKSGSCLVRYAGLRGGDHVLLVATGSDKEGLNALGGAERLRRLGAAVFHKLHAERIKEAVIYLDSFLLPANDLAIEPRQAAYAFFEGMGLAGYEFKKYFSKAAKDKKPAKDEEAFTAVVASGDTGRVAAYQEGLAQAEALVHGATVARDFGNEPSNKLYPAEFADRVRKLAAENRLKCTVLDERALAREKMGLLLGVGQGSIRPPRLMVLEYDPTGAKKGVRPKTIAFVGKGITFDSGGISIKPSPRMEDMKHDMCGAAAVVGAIVAAARLKLNTRIVCVVAAAENMPGGRAIQPGNILGSRAGKTVEITNTDAEGRLVLADALDYVQDLEPDYIIDLATLTGAVTIALGKACSALMGNDKAFNELVQAAARESGERVWELPLFDEYFDELKSEYADMKNSGDSPSHGTAKGAMFLKQFIRKDSRWVHLDIASMAYGVGGVPYYPKKSSTGYGVRLLVQLAKDLS